MQSKRWIPLVLLWLGVLWLLQLGMAQVGNGRGVWIVGRRVELGALPAGGVAGASISVVNLSARGVTVEVTPGCGCTLPEEPQFVLRAFGWKRVPVRVETAGLGAGEHGKVVRLRFQRGGEQWQDEVLLRFTVRESASPLGEVKR
ncbi:MAG: hypothetical protein NZ741_10150 [Armatimonadetes bacterium]|nr:hypothetical protein [Armatimonadota bacterium]